MFSISYQITCFRGESIEEKVRWICLEQSVELPEEVVPEHILNSVVGKVKEIIPLKKNKFTVVIEWPLENMGRDITQFLNILFGNISMKRGIKILYVDWQNLGHIFKGAKFGISGIRDKFNIHHRAITCAVLKPLGLSTGELADQAYQFGCGGIDLIKDDHGIADQIYAPFEERVVKVVEALKKAHSDSGKSARYFPNITTSGSKLFERYKRAKELGADGVMILPHLCGYEIMHELAQSEIDLPIIAHPAFSGSLVTSGNHGFSPAFLYGELIRAFGADFTVYPNYGGRFSFTKGECVELNFAARNTAPPFLPIFPMPGGGMRIDTLPTWIKKYGYDTVFLIGASLHQHPEGIKTGTQELQKIVDNTE